MGSYLAVIITTGLIAAVLMVDPSFQTQNTAGIKSGAISPPARLCYIAGDLVSEHRASCLTCLKGVNMVHSVFEL